MWTSKWNSKLVITFGPKSLATTINDSRFQQLLVPGDVVDLPQLTVIFPPTLSLQFPCITSFGFFTKRFVTTTTMMIHITSPIERQCVRRVLRTVLFRVNRWETSFVHSCRFCRQPRKTRTESVNEFLKTLQLDLLDAAFTSTLYFCRTSSSMSVSRNPIDSLFRIFPSREERNRISLL